MVREIQEVYNYHQEVRNLLLITLSIIDDTTLYDKLSYFEAKKLMEQEKIVQKIFELNQLGPKINAALTKMDEVVMLINKKLAAISQHYFSAQIDWKKFQSKNNGLIILAQYLVVILNETQSFAREIFEKEFK